MAVLERMLSVSVELPKLTQRVLKSIQRLLQERSGQDGV
jgi:hypothetical protein